MKNLRDIIKEDIDNIPDTRTWKKKGPQLGSNPGGTYSDHEGKDWYVKQSKSDHHAKNEMLANKLYGHLGVPTPDHTLVKTSKGLGTASPIIPIKNHNPYDQKDVSAIQKHLGAHALLANWDTIGLNNDNQAHTPKGMTTMDAGGSLNYRAQGAPKGAAFGNKAGEFDTLRDRNMNPEAANIFGKMKPHDLINTIHPVAALKNSTIHDVVHEHGPGDHEEKTQMVNKLIARKKDLIGKANGIAAKHGLPGVSDIDD